MSQPIAISAARFPGSLSRLINIGSTCMILWNVLPTQGARSESTKSCYSEHPHRLSPEQGG